MNHRIYPIAWALATAATLTACSSKEDGDAVFETAYMQKISVLDTRLQKGLSTTMGLQKKVITMDHPLPQTDEDRENGFNVIDYAYQVSFKSDQAYLMATENLNVAVSGRKTMTINAAEVLASCSRLRDVTKRPDRKDEVTRHLRLVESDKALDLYDRALDMQRQIYAAIEQPYSYTRQDREGFITAYAQKIADFETGIAALKQEVDTKRNALTGIFMSVWEKNVLLDLETMSCSREIQRVTRAHQPR